MAVLAAAVLTAVAAPARGETLREAMVAAYGHNPTLEAERARLRAIDEEVARAKAGRRPNISATGDVGIRDQEVDTDAGASVGASGLDSATRSGTHYPRGYAFTLTQPIFRGLRTRNAIREAEASIRAGRESLRSVQQQILLDAITAYMNVVRDQAIVGLRENNVKVLTEQLTATRDRFEVGEVTRTDVSQAEARRAGAISALNAAQADLKASRSVYERVIGHPPSNLQSPTPLESRLPNSLQAAMNIGDAENPQILEAVFLEEASRYAIKQIIGETRPEISLEAQFQERFDPSLSTDRQEETTVIGRLTVPLYSGGEPSARVRQARQTRSQRRREIDSARDVVRSDVVAAWSRLEAARAQIDSDEAQVRANRVALEGVREEEQVGQRTVLDVLDAEQALLNSQVELVGTRRDMVVASFTLYSAIGRLDAANLELPVAYYDPKEHYDRVRGKWFGFGLSAEEKEGIYPPR